MSTYVKHPKGYCYFSTDKIELDTLAVFKYLSDKNLIHDEKVIQAYQKVLAMSVFEEGHEYKNYHSDGKKHFFHHIDYYVKSKIEVNNEDSTPSLQEIEKSYFATLAIFDEIKILSAYLKQQKHKLSSLSTKEFTGYYDFKKHKKEHVHRLAHEQSYNARSSYQNVFKANEKELNKEYPQFKVMDVIPDFFDYEAINRVFKKLIKNYQLILDAQGKVLAIEESSFIDQFNQGKCYSIFTTSEDEDENGNITSTEGYLTQDGYSVDSLSNAKLFSNASKAKQCMTRDGYEGYICEVGLSFTKVEKKIGNNSINSLEAVMSHQEKQKIESISNSQDLAQQLFEALGDNQEALKAELSVFLEQSRPKTQKKNKI